MRSRLEAWLNRRWYPASRDERPGLWFLQPLAFAYTKVVRARRRRAADAAPARTELPTIVVGNLTVGGSGKTPLVAWLVGRLQDQGYRPGIVARGYGGIAPSYPRVVTQYSRPSVCGDEAVDLAQQTSAVVVVSPRRPQAVRWLGQMLECDMAVSDDGLQHVAMARDLEILVVSAERGFGNERLLPVGPLREPLDRLREVDLIVVLHQGRVPSDESSGPLVNPTVARIHRLAPDVPTLTCTAQVCDLVNLVTGERLSDRGPNGFANCHQRWVAISGIANPDGFHRELAWVEIPFEEVVFGDHHSYNLQDLLEFVGSGLLTTSKDAVKIGALIRAHAQLRDLDVWVLERTIELDAQAEQCLDGVLFNALPKQINRNNTKRNG